MSVFKIGLGSIGVGKPSIGSRGAPPANYGFERGVNISGQEAAGTTSAMISNEAIDYFASKGVDTIRFTYSMERIQPIPGGPLAQPYASQIKNRVDYITSKGIKVVLDPHNALRFIVNGVINDNSITGGTKVLIGQHVLFTNAHFADHHVKVHNYLHGPLTFHSLMNEPCDNNGTPGDGLFVDAALLRETYNTAIAALRAAGYSDVIFWSGKDFGNIYSWEANSDNRNVLAPGLVDPLNRLATDLHVYVDPWSSGTSSTVTDNFIDKLDQFAAYARSVGLKAFVGEFGTAHDAASISALSQLVAYFETNRDVFPYGYTYWTAVQFQPDGLLQILPIDLTNGGVPGPYTDRPQMDILESYFSEVPRKPTFVVPPSFGGYAVPANGLVGRASYGGVTAFPAAEMSYQWQYFDGAWRDIEGATSFTHPFGSQDVGYLVRRGSTATNSEGSTTAYTDAAGPVQSSPPPGYRWEYVTESTATDPNVEEDGTRVVELTRIAA